MGHTESRPSQGAIRCAGSGSTGRLPSKIFLEKKSLKLWIFSVSYSDTSIPVFFTNKGMRNADASSSRNLPQAFESCGMVSPFNRNRPGRV